MQKTHKTAKFSKKETLGSFFNSRKAICLLFVEKHYNEGFFKNFFEDISTTCWLTAHFKIQQIYTRK